MIFECPLFGRDRVKRKSCATNRAERTRSARLGSEVDLFRYGKGVIDLNAEISDRALDLGVAEQQLHGSQVASPTIDKGRLCSSQGMGAEQVRV
jgi:hypothetical protein